MQDRLKFSILTAAAALLAGMAHAGDYTVTGTSCRGDDCTSNVVGSDGWGWRVTGQGREATERAAQKLASEKNKEEEAGEEGSEETEKTEEVEGKEEGGFWDPCAGGKGGGAYGC